MNIKKPDRIFENKTNSPIKAIANILVNTERAINKYKPQIIFILGDTNSSISAIVAKEKIFLYFTMRLVTDVMI